MTFCVVIMLYAIDLDAAIVLGERKIVIPSLIVGFYGIDNPIFIDEMRRVDVGDYGESCWRHLTGFNEAATAHEVLLTPVASFTPRREVLNWLPVVDALHGAVNPTEAERHLDGIDIADHASTVGFGAVDAKPEI